MTRQIKYPSPGFKAGCHQRRIITKQITPAK
jgi:hypothetical protein